jgi:hypothetical protein
MVLRLRRLGAAAMLAAASIAAADAADPPATPGNSLRALDGHVFILSQLVPGPFSFTAFGTSTLGGYGNARGPLYDRSGVQIGTQDFPTGAFGQGLDFELAITRDVGLRFAAMAAAYSGVSARGAFAVGTTGQYSASAGGVVGHQFGPVRAAAVLDVGVRPQLSLLVANPVIEAIQTRQLDEGSALQSGSRFFVNPGLSAAWAPHPAFGLVGEARYLWLRQIVGDDVRTIRQGAVLAASADLDLHPLAGVPIGLQALCRFEVPFGDDSTEQVTQFGGGIYYTGRVRLQLGLEVVDYQSHLRPHSTFTLPIDAAIGTVRFRYYW